MRLFLVCLVLIVSSYAEAKTFVVDRLEASVNSTLILRSDITAFRKNVALRTQLDPLFSGSPLAEKGPRATDEEIANFLIDEKVISLTFPATDADVEQEINSIQANNKIDRGGLTQALAAQGFVFQDYFELIRASLCKRNLIDRDIRTKVYISDDDVKNYFYNHYTQASASALSYRIQIITISPGNYKSRQAALQTAQRAHAAIVAGEVFAEVAKQFSDDPSAPTGGDLGFVSNEEISPLLKEQVKKLKLGQVSEVFGNENTAYFILHLADMRSGQESRLKSMTEEIRNKLSSEEYSHQIKLWLDKERKRAFIHKAGESSLKNYVQ